MTRAVLGVVVAALVFVAGAALGASRPVAYCPLRVGTPSVSWAFHAGAPPQGATGSYAHGHGSVSGRSASGAICQVDRARRSPDRQIQLAITQTGVILERGITVRGVRGAELQLPVAVATSSDPACRIGTRGSVTLFSSYNGAHQDFATFTFPRACRDHDHGYHGPGVVVSLPS
jgi:hypothetical protein